ncbi:hypothetical protein UFOVP1290_501 [uncultured Caudovirales phage]|uniref:Uncharacterized protein n=1 Tax=uncultured Caudovirales phage TaxID=2100421 RepID=A0A6J5RTU3_9CAUD|nr:hypothetical protein UFOVP1290_501 [uncultured Caudovirales phage]
MARLLNTSEHIAKLEYDLAKLKFVSSKYPNYKLNLDKSKDEYIFSHKSVNSKFSNFNLNFFGASFTLNVFDELIFEYNGKKEKIIIDCIPKFCVVADINYGEINPVTNMWTKKLVINDLRFKSKNNELQKKMQNTCDLYTIKFIKANSGIKLDDNMPERIKKLIIFS